VFLDNAPHPPLCSADACIRESYEQFMLPLPRACLRGTVDIKFLRHAFLPSWSPCRYHRLACGAADIDTQGLPDGSEWTSFSQSRFRYTRPSSMISIYSYADEYSGNFGLIKGGLAFDPMNLAMEFPISLQSCGSSPGTQSSSKPVYLREG
jgi:hypothetical protein